MDLKHETPQADAVSVHLCDCCENVVLTLHNHEDASVIASATMPLDMAMGLCAAICALGREAAEAEAEDADEFGYGPCQGSA